MMHAFKIRMLTLIKACGTMRPTIKCKSVYNNDSETTHDSTDRQETDSK